MMKKMLLVLFSLVAFSSSALMAVDKANKAIQTTLPPPQLHNVIYEPGATSVRVGANGETVAFQISMPPDFWQGSLLLDTDWNSDTGTLRRYGSPDGKLTDYRGVDFEVAFDYGRVNVYSAFGDDHYSHGVQTLGNQITFSVPAGELHMLGKNTLRVALLLYGDQTFKLYPKDGFAGAGSIDAALYVHITQSRMIQGSDEKYFDIIMDMVYDATFTDRPELTVEADGVPITEALANLRKTEQYFRTVWNPERKGSLIRSERRVVFHDYPVDSLTPGTHKFRFKALTKANLTIKEVEVYVRPNQNSSPFF